jgi:hypothetical protein
MAPGVAPGEAPRACGCAITCSWRQELSRSPSREINKRYSTIRAQSDKPLDRARMVHAPYLRLTWRGLREEVSTQENGLRLHRGRQKPGSELKSLDGVSLAGRDGSKKAPPCCLF